MYFSRYHFDYDKCHISIDAKTGEILELYSSRNYDNIIKSQMQFMKRSFVVKTVNGDVSTEYSPLSSHQCSNKTDYYVKVESSETEEGLLIKVNYSVLTDGTNFVPTTLYYTVLLKNETFKFNICVKNEFNSGVINAVRFPVLTGVYLGEDYKDDYLVYPRDAGRKIKNPNEYFTNDANWLEWRWQDYKYGYMFDSVASDPILEELGLKGFTARYPSGGLCMPWLDLYDGEGGIYFGCHDKNVKPCRLSCASFIPKQVGTDIERRVGVVIYSEFEPYIEDGKEYVSPDVVLSFHSGDWHEGAKIYREFKNQYIKDDVKHLPEWAKDSPGLIAHYDFKYQHGGIVHKYCDIPFLAEKALRVGINHILLSGWNKGGFDNGYPEYVYDPDLGTEQELIDGIKKAKEMGVHVTFYMNRSLHNAAIHPETVKDKAVQSYDGQYKHSYWGNTAETDFYNMCPACKMWQDELCGHIKHATDVYGIDGLYLDILSAGLTLCFNKKHDHEFDAFNKGIQEILIKTQKNYTENHDDCLLIMGEHINDSVGNLVSYQLQQSFFQIKNHVFPNMYRYTFPSHGLIDVLYPTKNLAFRPNHVAQCSELLMAQAFTNGSSFWIYDLDGDATFDRDKEGEELLKQLVSMRRIMMRQASDYLFCDDEDILADNENVMVKTFKNGKNKMMLAGFRLKDGNTSVKFDKPVKKAKFVFFDGSEKTVKIKKSTLTMPLNKMFIAFID